MATLAAAAIAAGILPQRNGRRQTVNKQVSNAMVAHQLLHLSAHLPYRLVTIFSNSSAELISSLDSDQSGAFRLVFGLNQKAQPRTKPKSEVTQCIMAVVDRVHCPALAHRYIFTVSCH